MSDSESDAGDRRDLFIESVWEKFERPNANNEIECTVCNRTFIFHHNTTNQWKHLATHRIYRKIPDDGKPSDDRPAKRQRTLLECEFVITQRDELDMMYTEMVAKQGWSFNSIGGCNRLYDLCQRSNLRPLKDPTAIRDRVLKVADQEIEADRLRLEKLIKKGHKFVLTLDEWTSNDTRRFMSIVLHLDKGTDLNLGLVRVRGRATAENLIAIMNKKLGAFGLKFERDIIGIDTDGSKTMLKFGRLLSPFCFHQICQLHSVHLGVLDTFYKPNLTLETRPAGGDQPDDLLEFLDDTTDCNLNDPNDAAIPDEDLNEAFQPTDAELDLRFEFCDSIGPSIAAVRKIVTLFHKSGKNQEILESAILSLDPNETELTLIMDVRTRWSALFKMVARFVKLYDGIKIALIKLKKSKMLDDIDLDILEQLVEVLGPVKAVVEKLSSASIDLFEAHLITTHLLKTLGGMSSSLSEYLRANLEQRLLQRSGIHSAILVYLTNGQLIDGTTLSRIKTETLNYFKRIETASGLLTGDSEDESDENHNTLNEDQLGRLKFEEQLQYIVANKEKTVSKPPSKRLEVVKREMTTYQNTKVLGENLKELKRNLETMKPSSIASERTFSVAGQFKTKLRSRLADGTLDKLVYLRYKFLNGNLK